jgi:hypothetical protein
MTDTDRLVQGLRNLKAQLPPQPVTIVRPYVSPRRAVTILAARVLATLATAWLLMLAVPFVFGATPSYLQALVGYCLFRVVFTSHDFGFWSQAGTKP